jgi:bacteriophage HK97-gp10 putative tail-component
VSIDRHALEEFLTGPTGPVARHMEELARQVENEAKRRCPVDEGRLRASIQHTVHAEGTRVIARVGSDLDYAAYVHHGTGIYGPRHARIHPVSAQVLSWVPRSGGMGSRVGRGRKGARETTRVFARSTRGMPPRPFLVEALQAISPWPVTVTSVV